jgi:hypothetical protein
MSSLIGYYLDCRLRRSWCDWGLVKGLGDVALVIQRDDPIVVICTRRELAVWSNEVPSNLWRAGCFGTEWNDRSNMLASQLIRCKDGLACSGCAASGILCGVDVMVDEA